MLVTWNSSVDLTWTRCQPASTFTGLLHMRTSSGVPLTTSRMVPLTEVGCGTPSTKISGPRPHWAPVGPDSTSSRVTSGPLGNRTSETATPESPEPPKVRVTSFARTGENRDQA